jgi:hypothetical protein
MQSVKRIKHTVVSDGLFSGNHSDSADCKQVVQEYIRELYDALESEFPEARILIVEMRPGCADPGGTQRTVVELEGNGDTASVIRRIEARAAELRQGSAWRVGQFAA